MRQINLAPDPPLQASPRSCPLRRTRRSLFIIIILRSYLLNTLPFKSRHARMLHYNEPYFKHQPERKHIMKMDRDEFFFRFSFLDEFRWMTHSALCEERQDEWPSLSSSSRKQPDTFQEVLSDLISLSLLIYVLLLPIRRCIISCSEKNQKEPMAGPWVRLHQAAQIYLNQKANLKTRKPLCLLAQSYSGLATGMLIL